MDPTLGLSGHLLCLHVCVYQIDALTAPGIFYSSDETELTAEENTGIDVESDVISCDVCLCIHVHLTVLTRNFVQMPLLVATYLLCT